MAVNVTVLSWWERGFERGVYVVVVERSVY